MTISKVAQTSLLRSQPPPQSLHQPETVSGPSDHTLHPSITMHPALAARALHSPMLREDQRSEALRSVPLEHPDLGKLDGHKQGSSCSLHKVGALEAMEFIFDEMPCAWQQHRQMSFTETDTPVPSTFMKLRLVDFLQLIEAVSFEPVAHFLCEL